MVYFTFKLTSNSLDNTLLDGNSKDTLYGKDDNDYLSGNAGADKLYGQKRNDTFWGGIDDDTLTDAKGADVLIYNSEEKKDFIIDFADDDLFQITGTFSATYDSSANTIVFKVGSTTSAITLINFTSTSFQSERRQLFDKQA